MAFKLFGQSQHQRAAHDLYSSVIGQSRQTAFYQRMGVPDSVDGRFDMIVLHAFLIMRRLKRIAEDGAGRREAAQAAALSQAVFDLMFADMDQNLREMGVGDLGVGRRVKRMATGFYGRVAAYDEGLDAAGERVLEEGLRRNLYGTTPGVGDGVLKAMAGYLRREAARLDGQPLDSLLAGHVDFGGLDD